ncbi:hypothetical protein M758_6G002300 [Ceratodon purpureus]|nr:hypothetical protein M758_6G002300 [Ceratodon purpureus]
MVVWREKNVITSLCVRRRYLELHSREPPSLPSFAFCQPCWWNLYYIIPRRYPASSSLVPSSCCENSSALLKRRTTAGNEEINNGASLPALDFCSTTTSFTSPL